MLIGNKNLYTLDFSSLSIDQTILSRINILNSESNDYNDYNFLLNWFGSSYNHFQVVCGFHFMQVFRFSEEKKMILFPKIFLCGKQPICMKTFETFNFGFFPWLFGLLLKHTHTRTHAHSPSPLFFSLSLSFQKHARSQPF